MALSPVQIVLSVSTSLNDQEPGFTYLRWPQLELLDYLNEALIQIGTYRPDAFMVTNTITLSPGSQQSLNSGAVSFLKSIDSNDPNGTCSSAPITQVDLALMRAFYKKPCLPTGGAAEYRVLSYAYDAKNPRIFYVSPPVPAGGAPRLVATFVKHSEQYDSGTMGNNLDVDPKYYNLIKFWMLARAYEVDTESSTSQSESQGYYKKFWTALGVQYKQESDYSSGKFIGQGGVNQMSKQRPL